MTVCELLAIACIPACKISHLFFHYNKCKSSRKMKTLSKSEHVTLLFMTAESDPSPLLILAATDLSSLSQLKAG